MNRDKLAVPLKDIAAEQVAIGGEQPMLGLIDRDKVEEVKP